MDELDRIIGKVKGEISGNDPLDAIIASVKAGSSSPSVWDKTVPLTSPKNGTYLGAKAGDMMALPKPKPPEMTPDVGGVGPALKAGFYRAKSGLAALSASSRQEGVTARESVLEGVRGTAGESIIRGDIDRERKLAQEAEASRIKANEAAAKADPNPVTSSTFADAVKQGRVLDAAHQATSAMAGQLPQMIPFAAAARFGGPGAATAVLYPQLTGSNLERQAAEGRPLEQRNLQAAGLAAIPQTAAEGAADYFMAGPLLRLAGKVPIGRGAAEAAKQTLRQNVGRAAVETAKRVPISAAAEGTTEYGQQLLERAQAGLSPNPLTSPEAHAEAKEAGLMGALIGAGMGAVGGPIEAYNKSRVAEPAPLPPPNVVERQAAPVAPPAPEPAPLVPPPAQTEFVAPTPQDEVTEVSEDLPPIQLPEAIAPGSEFVSKDGKAKYAVVESTPESVTYDFTNPAGKVVRATVNAGEWQKISKRFSPVTEQAAAPPIAEPTPSPVVEADPLDSIIESVKAESAPEPVAPQVLTPEVIAPETKTEPSKPVYEMSREELSALKADLKAKEDGLLTSLFGEAGAREYRSAERSANSSTNPQRADAASKIVQKMEARLTEEQRNQLYGIGEVGPVFDDVVEYDRALGRVDTSTPQATADSIKWALTRMGDVKDPAQMDPAQQVAYAQLRTAFSEAKAAGQDLDWIVKEAASQASTRFSDPADAAFMLERFLKPDGKPAPAKQPAALPPVAQAEAPLTETEPRRSSLSMTFVPASELPPLAAPLPRSPVIPNPSIENLEAANAAFGRTGQLEVEVSKPRTESKSTPNWNRKLTTIEVQPKADTTPEGWDARMGDIRLQVIARVEAKAGETSKAPKSKDPIWFVYDKKSQKAVANGLTRDEAIATAQREVERQWNAADETAGRATATLGGIAEVGEVPQPAPLQRGRRSSQRGSIPVKTGQQATPPAPHYEFIDKNAAVRMESAAKPTPQPDFKDRLAKAQEEWRQYFRIYRHIPRNSHPAFVYRLLQQEKAEGWATNKAALEILQTVKEFSSDTERYRTFTTKLVLDDLTETLDRWVVSGEVKAEDAADFDMPFGFTGATLRAEQANVTQFAQNDPAIVAALARRKQMWGDIRTRYIAAMEAAGIKMDGKLTREDYFRHRVLEYMEAGRGAKEGGNELQTPARRSHLKRRKSSAAAKDISTNYAEAEFQVLSQILKDTKTAELIGWIRSKSNLDILPQLKQEAKGTEDGWESLVPDTHEVWYAEPGNYFYTAYTVPERIAKEVFENIGESVGITSDDLRKVIALGGKKNAMVLPKEVVATLNEFGKEVQKSGFVGIADKWWIRSHSAWKRWVLVAPHRFFKYNMRNYTGDAEILFVGNRKAFGKKGQAGRELSRYFLPIIQGQPESAVMSPTLESWFDRGGFQSMIQAQELGDVHNFDAIRQLENIQGDGRTNPWTWYWDKAQVTTNFREAHLRYAAYLDYLSQMEKNADGLPDNFGASRAETIMALDDKYDRAYVLANQLMGAYDEVSIAGKAIRARLMSFFSYQETNLRRYFNLVRNAAKMDEISEKVGRKLAGGGKGKASALTALYLGKVAMKMMAGWAALYAYNKLRYPDEWEDLPPEAKRVPTLILGRNADGTVKYFNRLGNVSDLLEWLDPFEGSTIIKDWMSDRISFPKMVGALTVSGPGEKIAQSLGPQFKIPVELALGVSIYPDIRKPRQIRDRMEYIADQFGLGAGHLYRKATGKPMSPLQRSTWAPIVSTLWYEADPAMTGYFEFLKVKSKWMLDNGNGDGGVLAMGQTARGEALYYAKQSIRKQDKEAFERWFTQYVALGGKSKNQTWASFDPLSGIRKADRNKFINSLNDDEREMLRQAKIYHADVMKRKNEYVAGVRPRLAELRKPKPMASVSNSGGSTLRPLTPPTR